MKFIRLLDNVKNITFRTILENVNNINEYYYGIITFKQIKFSYPQHENHSIYINSVAETGRF